MSDVRYQLFGILIFSNNGLFIFSSAIILYASIKPELLPPNLPAPLAAPITFPNKLLNSLTCRKCFAILMYCKLSEKNLLIKKTRIFINSSSERCISALGIFINLDNTPDISARDMFGFSDAIVRNLLLSRPSRKFIWSAISLSLILFPAISKTLSEKAFNEARSFLG